MSWQNIPNWYLSTRMYILCQITQKQNVWHDFTYELCLPSLYFFIWHGIFVHRSMTIVMYAPLLWKLKLHLVVVRRYRFFCIWCLFSHTRNIAVNDIFSRGVTNEPIHISPWLQHRLPLHIITTRWVTTMDQSNNCNFWIASFESNHNPIHLYTGWIFKWASPEFAKCWPVSSWFQKNVRVPDWPPFDRKTSGEVNMIPTLRKFRGGPVQANLGGGAV